MQIESVQTGYQQNLCESMKVTLLKPEDPRWQSELSHVQHEFYHMPDYLSLEAQRLKGIARALLVTSDEASLILPLILREVSLVAEDGNELSFKDAVSPYGYPGPLVNLKNGDKRSFVQAAIEAASPVLRETGVVCAFVRMNPFLNNSPLFSGVGSLVESGSVVWIDLALSTKELQRGMRSRFRSYLNATLRSGATVRFDLEWRHLEDFTRLYYLSMDRVGAADWYYFDRSYFQSLRSILGDDLKLCVIEKDEEVVAAGLFAVSGGIVQYLFSGTDIDSGLDHATKLMMVFVRDWAKASGNSIFHLGGGVGGGKDNLGRFKQGFSKLMKPFYTWRLIFDFPTYNAAIRAWNFNSQQTNGKQSDKQNDFFPRYREQL